MSITQIKQLADRSKEMCQMAGEHYDLKFVKSAIGWPSVYFEVVSTTWFSLATPSIRVFTRKDLLPVCYVREP